MPRSPQARSATTIERGMHVHTGNLTGDDMRRPSYMSPPRMRARLALQEMEPRLTPTGPIPPPSGLVSWWPGDGDTTDIVGPNSGSLVGPAGHHQGYVADGFEFDGQSSLMEAPTIGLPVGSADRT